MFNVLYILALLPKFLRYNIYKKKLCLPYKYYFKLFLFYILFLIVRFYKIIQVSYDFGYKKSKTQEYNIGKIRIAIK